MATRTKEFWLRPGERARSSVSDIEPWLFMKYSDENTSNPRIFTGDDFPTSPDAKELIVYAHKRIHVQFNLDPHMIISSYPEWILPGQSFTVTVACTDDTYTFYGWGDRGYYEPEYRTRTFTGPSDWSDIEVDVKEHKKIHVNITAEDGAEIVNEYPEWIILHDFFTIEARMVDEERYLWDNWSDGNTNFIRTITTPDSWDDIELVAQTKQKIHVVITAEEGLTLNPSVYPEWILPGDEITITAIESEGYIFLKWSDQEEREWPPYENTRTFVGQDDWSDIIVMAESEKLVDLIIHAKRQDGSASVIPDAHHWVRRGHNYYIGVTRRGTGEDGVSDGIYYWEDDPSYPVLDSYNSTRKFNIPYEYPEDSITYTAIVGPYYYIDAKDQYPEHTPEFDIHYPYLCEVEGIDWYKNGTTCTLKVKDKERSEYDGYAAYFQHWEDGDTSTEKDFLVTAPDTKIIYCREEFLVNPLATYYEEEASYHTIPKDRYHIEGTGWYWYGDTATLKYVMDQQGENERSECKYWTDYFGNRVMGDTITAEIIGVPYLNYDDYSHLIPHVEFTYYVDCEVEILAPELKDYVNVELYGNKEWHPSHMSSTIGSDLVTLGALVTTDPPLGLMTWDSGWYITGDGYWDWVRTDFFQQYPETTEIPVGNAHDSSAAYRFLKQKLRLHYTAPMVYIENEMESGSSPREWKLKAYEITPSATAMYEDGQTIQVKCRAYLTYEGTSPTPTSGVEAVRLYQWNGGNYGIVREIETDGHEGWYECTYEYKVKYTSDVHTFLFSCYCPYEPMESHKLTLEGEHCTLSGAGVYVPGDVVEVSCTPDEGYKFVQWSDGDTNATRTITIGNEDIHLVATCEDTRVDVTIDNEMEEGTSTYWRLTSYTISPAEPFKAIPGEVIHISATATVEKIGEHSKICNFKLGDNHSHRAAYVIREAGTWPIELDIEVGTEDIIIDYSIAAKYEPNP